MRFCLGLFTAFVATACGSTAPTAPAAPMTESAAGGAKQELVGKYLVESLDGASPPASAMVVEYAPDGEVTVPAALKLDANIVKQAMEQFVTALQGFGTNINLTSIDLTITQKTPSPQSTRKLKLAKVPR